MAGGHEEGIRVLCVDDDPDMVSVVATHLERERETLEVVTETEPSAVVDDYDVSRFSCLVSDYNMAGMDGLELLREVRDEYPTKPFILLTGQGSERVASEAISAGVTEYFRKQEVTDQYTVLANRIERTVEHRTTKQELDRYETIIQAVGDPVYTLDAEGRFTFVNEAFEAMTGYDASELVGESVKVIIREEDAERGREAIRDLLATDDARTAKYELTIVTADGEHVPCELQLSLLPFEDSFRGTAGVVRDITTRKRREERLEEFAGVVAHDLRGPLNAMLGRVELAARTGEDEHFERVFDAIDRMDTLIEDLLTLARQGNIVGETEPVSLAAVASTAWNEIETDGGTIDIESNTTLEADRGRLKEALANLFQNALEHGGEEVRVGSLDRREGFFVADDGPGIPPDRRADIFDRGFTTASDGTGFGLSIVQRIVEAHEWRIDVAESADGGARFEVETI